MTSPATHGSSDLAPVSFDGTALALAADLAAVEEVAGDGFEFRCDPDRVRFAVFDAMGSDHRSAALVAVVATAYREALAAELELVATADLLDQVVVDRCGGEAYCTGVLVELDTGTGQLRALNAGHPSLLLLDLSTREQQQLATAANLSFGLSVLLDDTPAPVVNSHQLQPGQVVAAYTDGVTEARASNREFLGERRVAEALIQLLAGGLCPAEAVTQMMRFLHLFQNGSPRDDSTLLLAQWRGPLPLAG